jgi:hypothetical protein
MVLLGSVEKWEMSPSWRKYVTEDVPWKDVSCPLPLLHSLLPAHHEGNSCAICYRHHCALSGCMHAQKYGVKCPRTETSETMSQNKCLLTLIRCFSWVFVMVTKN